MDAYQYDRAVSNYENLLLRLGESMAELPQDGFESWNDEQLVSELFTQPFSALTEPYYRRPAPETLARWLMQDGYEAMTEGTGWYLTRLYVTLARRHGVDVARDVFAAVREDAFGQTGKPCWAEPGSQLEREARIYGYR